MKKIGFIGAGNMATAIIKGLMAQNDGKADFINVYDLSAEKCEIIKAFGTNICTSSADVVKISDIIVLAVKPQNYPEVLAELKPVVDISKTFVSIAAGISISYVQSGLDCKTLLFYSKRVRLHFVRLTISAKRTKKLCTKCSQAAAFVNT
jgi:pyrroline-5-carboxylate reductase